MIKAIIQIRGYTEKKSSKLRKSIIKCMKNTKIGSSVSCEVIQSNILSCDGKETSEPYMTIITPKRKYATTIVEEFKKNKIHELVVITLDKMFISAEEIASGK